MFTRWRLGLFIAVALLVSCASGTVATSNADTKSDAAGASAEDEAATVEPTSTEDEAATVEPASADAATGTDEQDADSASATTGRIDELAEPTPIEQTTEAGPSTPAEPDAPPRELDENDMPSTSVPSREPEPTPEREPTPPPCQRLTDFAIDAANLSWFIVNDNVMGGQSSGGPTFGDSTMVFEGEINTDGGGFSSVRVGLGSNTLTGFTELAVRARTDGRSYKLILEDSLETRDRRVSQQGSLEFASTTEWQTVRVAFADLAPRIFGRAVQSEAFRPDLATQLGIMISDGVDGPFRVEIDWIDACP